MQFRSISDLSATIHSQLHIIPKDVDLVVGIPRSGMLPASILALALNCRLSDVDRFSQGQWLKSGGTRPQSSFGEIKHALVIDDSIRTGGTMRRIRAELRPDTKVTYCAVYGAGRAHSEVDLVLEDIPSARAFEWNVMHHPGMLGIACVDIDGILCVDPTGSENDDGPEYRRFLQSPRQRFTPTGEMHTIVTSRLEKYRPQTEQWLASQGIRYRNLEMLDLPDAETRRRLGSHAKFKASVYRRTATHLFIESEEWQAREIAILAGKPVLHFAGTPRMIYPSALTPRGAVWNARKIASSIRRRLVEAG